MKALRQILTFLAICATLCRTTAPLRADDGKPSLYMALFRVTVAEDNSLKDFETAKVIDLLSGSNDAAAVELPKTFISQAKKKIADAHFKPVIRDGKLTSTLVTFLYSPPDEKRKSPGISFSAFDGAMNSISEFRLLGQEAAVATFGTDFGRSACFVGYYSLSLPKATTAQRQAIVEAEFQRSATNVPNSKILSRSDASTDSQTIMDFTCKSSGKNAFTIRSRYICNDRQMLGSTAVTPDGSSAEDNQLFDQLVNSFRFRIP